ncbi:hypothetical protein OS21_01260 [Dickeya oryzae]
MKFFALFIHRPVATTLLALAIALCGLLGYQLLPVSPLPQVDYPVISVTATMPGASPETMASSVATPLERSLGRIAGVNEMTSMSSLGNTRIILQFALDRDINGAARDVQAAINAAQSLLPSNMPSRPYYRKVNPSDAPIMIITLTSDTYGPGQLYDYASTQVAQRVSQIDGVGDVTIGGSSLPAVRVELNPQALFNQGVSLDTVRQSIAQANVRQPLGSVDSGNTHYQIQTNDELKTANVYRSLIIHYNNGAPVRLSDVATVKRLGAERPQRRDDQRQTGGVGVNSPRAGCKHHLHRGCNSRRHARIASHVARLNPPEYRTRPLAHHSCLTA